MSLQPIETAPDEGLADLQIVEPLCAIFRRALKAEGLKYTPERAAILDAIIRIDGLFEAEQLLEMLKRERFRVSKATIYRTLKLLDDSGIVQKVLFDKDQSHYQLAYGQRSNTVLIRVDTGEVLTLDMPELLALRDRVCRERGLVPEGHRLQIFARLA